LVSVIGKNLLAEFVCLLLLLVNRVTTVRRQRRRREQQRLPPPTITKKDKIAAAVADEIIAALDGKDIGAMLAEALKHVAASDKPLVYWRACKKCLQDDYGLLIPDSGHVGILTGVHPKPDVYRGDIIVYTVLDMLKTGDYVQVLQLTDVKDLAVEHTSGSQRSHIIDGTIKAYKTRFQGRRI
jgi:hypothetical protein